MLRRRHIAEKVCSCCSCDSASYSSGNVVVSHAYIGDKRAKHIKRRSLADLFFNLYVQLDLIKRHVARPFDNDLHIAFHCPVTQLAQR